MIIFLRITGPSWKGNTCYVLLQISNYCKLANFHGLNFHCIRDREIYIPRKIPCIRYLDVSSRSLCDVMLLLTKAIILQYNMVRAQNNSRTKDIFQRKTLFVKAYLNLYGKCMVMLQRTENRGYWIINKKVIQCPTLISM